MELATSQTTDSLFRVFDEGLKDAIPAGKLTVSEWAEQKRFVSPERSARPGRWDNSLVPFLVGVMDAVTDPAVRKIVMMKSSQVAGTEFLINALCYFIDQDASLMMYIAETEDKAKAWKQEAFDTTVAATPCLRAKIMDAGQTSSDNNQRMVRFPGGQLSILHASSPAQLSSRPARIVAIDEVDACKATSEGDPVKLAEARMKTFNESKKLLLVSSPRDEETSTIEKEYLLGDQREYYVPCPHCDEYQTLKWANVKWDEDPQGAYMVCVECGAVIDNDDKTDMLAAGKWIAGAEFKDSATFRINELYSPFTNWGDMAVDFLQAKKHRDTFRVFVNTRLGETFKDAQTIDYADISLHREDYAFEVPDGVYALTAGVDVQGDRLEVEVVGWGLERENWSIDYRVFQGSPTLGEVWDELEEYLLSPFVGRDGRTFKIKRAAIDTGGHHTDETYAFVKKNTNKPGRYWHAIKGVTGIGDPLVKKGSIVGNQKVRLWLVGTNTAKDEIFSHLAVETQGMSGFCHFPNDDERYGDDYLKQLCSEKKVPKYRMGRQYHIYEKVSPSVRNEALDVRVYAIAARAIAMPFYDKWSRQQARKAVKALDLDAGILSEPEASATGSQDTAENSSETVQNPPQNEQKQPENAPKTGRKRRKVVLSNRIASRKNFGTSW